MTVTSSLPRTPGHPATGLSRCARTLRVALALLLVPLLMLGVASPAVAATEDEPDPAPLGVTFTLAPLSGGVLSAEAPLAASAVVVNGTALALSPAPVTLELATDPITDRAALQAWLDGDTAGIATEEVATARVGVVPAGEQESVSLRLAADDPALAGLDPGVYPILGRYDDRVSTSAVVVPGDAATPIAVILPVTAAPATDGLLSAAELTALTDVDGDLTALLDAAEGTSAVLAVDPAIAAAIRVLGSDAPESASAWLERLLTLPNERVALQFGDADVAVQVAAGRTSPLSPTSLAAYVDPAGLAEPTAEPTPTPSETPDASPALPPMEELMDVAPSGPAIYSPAPDGVTAEVATVLSGEEDAPATLAWSDRTAPGAAGATVAAAARVDAASVLVVDAGISAAASTAALEDEVLLRAAPVAAITALTALAAEDADGAPLLVMLDRGTERSRLALHAGLSAVLDAPGAVAATLTEIAGADAQPVTLTAAGTADDRIAAYDRLRQGESDVDAFASILEDPAMLTGPQRASLLQLLAVSWTTEPGRWSIAVNDAYADTAQTLDSVGILPPSSIQLLSSETPLPFWIRNDLPFPVDVVLFATPDDLRLEVQRMTPVEASPSSNTRVQVPVQARVGSGELTIDLQLRSPTGVAIGDRQSADVHVRAEWEAFGIVGLALIVGGLLVVGVVRTIRRRVRARRTADEPAEIDA